MSSNSSGDNILRHYPVEKHQRYLSRMAAYYDRLMPLLYARFFGIAGMFRKVFAQIVGCFRPMVREVSEADMRVVVHKSLGMVVQTFMLAMSEQGMDTCPIEGFDSARLRRTLGLPRGVWPSVVVSCGVRLPKGVRGDRYRQPFDRQYRRI